MLIEYYSHENPYRWTVDTDYRAVVKDNYKYIKWLRYDEEELYDLVSDPYEQNNLIHDGDKAGIVRDLRENLKSLVLASMDLDTE